MLAISEKDVTNITDGIKLKLFRPELRHLDITAWILVKLCFNNMSELKFNLYTLMILMSISVLYLTPSFYLYKGSVESVARPAAVSCKKLGESDEKERVDWESSGPDQYS